MVHFFVLSLPNTEQTPQNTCSRMGHVQKTTSVKNVAMSFSATFLMDSSWHY